GRNALGVGWLRLARPRARGRNPTAHKFSCRTGRGQAGWGNVAPAGEARRSLLSSNSPATTMRGLSLVCGMAVIAARCRRLVVRGRVGGRIADVRCVVRVAVAAPVVVIIEAAAKPRHQTPTAEMPFVAEVAAGRREGRTRNAPPRSGG